MLSNYNSPAETLIYRRDERLFNDVILSIIAGTAYLGLLLIFWINYYFPFKGSMWFVSITCIGIAAYFFLKAWKNYRAVKVMNVGIKSERDVGHFLQQTIAPLGYRVLNSLSRNHHDIDHVIVGPTGVYCIETKNLQWMLDNPVEFDGKEITINGKGLPHKDPIKQAKSAALEVSQFLQAHEIQQFITPVVLLPGRIIHGIQTQQIIVGNMKIFEEYICGAKPILSAKQVKLFADVLSHANQH
jgi:hypothetical protein